MNKKRFRSLLQSRFFIAILLIVQIAFLSYALVSSSLTSTVMGWSMTALSIFTAIYIIASKNKGAYKLTWVFLLLVFPVFGGLFYLIFKCQTSHKKANKRICDIEKKIRKLYYLPSDSFDEAKKSVPEYIAQINYLQNFAGFPVYNGTETTYLTSGEEKWEYLLKELAKAQKYIFLEYFIIQEGKMWNQILEILKRKAADGVLVRLIYDDVGCFLTLPKNYDKILNQYSIECVVFNPFRPVLSTVQNNRTHRKIAVIDGKVAFTGGVNLADEYINAVNRFGHWKDSAIMLKGKAAWSFALMHLQMWELCTGKKEDYASYYPWHVNACEGNTDGFVQPYCDSPLDTENIGEHVYLHIINTAKKYVYINTPYLIIDDSMLSALCLAAKSGVDVRIVTPHTPDKWAVHMTTRSYYRELVKAGVKIYEYSNGFIHSKTFVADDNTAVVGTTNLDFRSLYLHFECGVRMYGSKAVSEVRDDFIKTLESCHMITSKDCKTNIFMRIFQDVMRIFAPLM